jgi:hypothetical protein
MRRGKWTAAWLSLSLILAIASTGCRTGGAAEGGTAPDGSVIVMEGSELSGTLLDGLRIRVPAMLVTERSGQCPLIIFRGQRSMATQGNPSLYVDGTLMSDTCLLSQMPTSDVRSVEVYPSGNTSRPGIQRNPFGIILVFRNRA